RSASVSPSRRRPPDSYCSTSAAASAEIAVRVSLSTSLMTCTATSPSTSAAPIEPKPKIANVRRKAVERSVLTSAVTDHVSGAAHGVDKGGVEIAIDLGAQSRHMHVDDVGLRVEVIVPDVFQQHGAGDDLAGVLHEIFEQPVLARLQHDLLA